MRNKKTDIDTKKVKEFKYSYSNSERVASIKVDNIDKSKVYDETNYVFVGNSTVVVKGNKIQYIQLFEA